MLKEKQFVWQENPLRELMHLAWPICVSMLSYSAMTVADTAFVSSTGSASLAGVGLGGMLAFAILGFGIGLLRALKVLVSQAVGAGERTCIPQLEAAGLVVALGLGLVLGGLGQLVCFAVPLLADSSAAGVVGADYLQIRLLAAPLYLLFSASKESAYGLGDTRSPMIASLIGNLANIVLDYIFIIVLKTGAQGAAWATLIATTVELTGISLLRRRRFWKSVRGSMAWVRPILRMGVATGAQFAAEIGAFTVLTVLVASMAESEMAGHQVAITVVYFGFLPIVAIGEAGSVLAGQVVGANRDELFPRIARVTYLVGAAYAAAFSAFLLLWGNDIAVLFGDEFAVHEVAARLLLIAAGFQVVDSANIVSRSLLRGAGDVRFSAVVCTVVSWLALPPLTYLLGIELGLGASGAWFALCCEIVISACLLSWRIVGGGWRNSARRSRMDLQAG